MDLFAPSKTMSFGGNYYVLVIVGDYSRTFFISHKNDDFVAFVNLLKLLKMKKIKKIVSCSSKKKNCIIRSDHGG